MHTGSSEPGLPIITLCRLPQAWNSQVVFDLEVITDIT